SDFEEDRSVLVMEKEPDPYSNLELAEAIHAGLLERVQESSRDIYRGLKADFKELLDRISNMIPDEMSLEIRELMRDLKECVKQERFNKMPDMVSQSYDIMKTAKEKAKETYYLENCSEILEIVFSIENDEAKALITDSQDLAKRIGKGEIKGVEDEIKEMGKKARALRDLQDIQDLESMLQNIRDMDNLANDISSNIDEQNGLYESVQKIISVIGTMIDRLSKLHNNPGREMVEDMKVQITTTREDLVEIENLWRAGRRLESLKEAGLSEGNIGGPLLLDDIGNLNNQYKNREWTKFFRTWERIETQMKKMERRGELKGFNMEWFRSMTKGSDKGMEVLSRKQMQIPKDKMGYRPRSRKGGGGIQKLAQDMGEKRKKLEKAPMVKSDKKENEKDPREVDQKELEGRTKGEDELMGIARLIAGKRIKELKKDRSKALEEEGGSEMLWKNDRSDRISPADPVKDLEDYMDLDTSLRRSDISEDISKVRDKLILFFDKLPELSQLDDASEHFERGEEALRKEENNKALG
ncbi:MAG: hypothetical protein U9R75_12225, partial [Candidatus Thermoplasmatota archaeon]|nr:hypothetical protein [Candidatus Thermoplasmatota archaeon]